MTKPSHDAKPSYERQFHTVKYDKNAHGWLETVVSRVFSFIRENIAKNARKRLETVVWRAFYMGRR